MSNFTAKRAIRGYGCTINWFCVGRYDSLTIIIEDFDLILGDTTDRKYVERYLGITEDHGKKAIKGYPCTVDWHATKRNLERYVWGEDKLTITIEKLIKVNDDATNRKKVEADLEIKENKEGKIR